MNSQHRTIGVIAVGILAVLSTWATLEFEWFPALISAKDGRIDGLYDALLVASVPIFVGVTAFIIYCVIEFRARPGQEDADGVPIHGNSMLEFVWTLIPTLIVATLGVYAWVVLNDVEAKQPNELRVKVIGQQFAWRFEYPSLGVKSNDLVVPEDRPLYFDITSEDVIHSFFVPNVRLKRDAAEGVTTHLRFTPEKTGRYPIICAELCGIGHSTMRQTMSVVPTSEFEDWVKSEKSGGKKSGGAVDGAAVFTDAGCGSCHTLAAAKATGQAGPKLDGYGDQGAAKVREAIVKPDAEIATGFSAGVMPGTFGDQLSPEELDALVDFIVKAAK